MSFATGVYNINDVNAIVNGWTIQALAGDKPLETERTEPKEWKKKIGSKGEGTFVFQPDKSGNFIIRVKENSTDDVKTLHDLKDSGAIFPTEFNNTVTKEKATGQFCMIEEVARIQFNSADEAELEFKIGTVELVETRGK